MFNTVEYKSLLAITAHTAAGTGSTGAVDCLGYRAARFTVVAGTTNPVSTLTVQHSDTTIAGDFATISGGTGATDFTIGVASGASPFTANNVVSIDLRGKKRYIRIVHGGATAQTVFTSIDLFNPIDLPDNGLEVGATATTGLVVIY
mgnify:CR=1 FL=1